MDKVMEFLGKHSICTIATCSNNKPRSSTMEYVIVNGHVHFATNVDSIKANNLKQNNKISLTAHGLPQFVVIDGTVVPATADEIAAYTQVLFERHPERKELIERGIMGTLVHYKLIPEVAYFSDSSAGMAPPEIIKF